jgi:small-conductance mechanosensitive channel
VLLLGFFAAAAAAGIDMNKFAVLAGAFGVGIGFGLQNVVNNFVSGLILLYERPIQVGDAIEVEGVAGDVTRIGVRSSTLRTGEGAEVIVPNATIIAERVTNWTLTDRTRRLEIRVGAAYGSDPRRVIEILLRCAREHPAVLATPDPVALLLEFGDSALAFELRFWTHFDAAIATRAAIAIAIVDAFAAAGIAMPFPQRDVHLYGPAPEAARAASGDPKR